MPNWVMNELTCTFQTPEEYNAFKMKANTEGLFNSFIPMPSVLENTRCPHLEPNAFIELVNSRKNTRFITLEGIAFGSDDKFDAETAKQLIQNLKAFSETGYHEWYAWNLDNWCSYANFADAVRDGKWGGWGEWEHLFEESEY